MKQSITKENVEEWILLLLDDELSQEQEEMLSAFLKEHSEYEEIRTAYQQTKLPPEELEAFPGKEKLYRKIPAYFPISEKKHWRSLAAALLIIIGGGWLIWEYNPMAQPTGTTPATAVANDSISSPPTLAAATQKIQRTADDRRNHNNHATARSGKKNLFVRVVQKKPTGTLALATVDTMTTTRIALQPLPNIRTVSPALLRTPPGSVRDLSPKTIAHHTVHINNDRPAREEKEVALAFPEWVPISADRLQGVNDLISHVQQVKEKVATELSELKITTVAFQIGNKQITLAKKEHF